MDENVDNSMFSVAEKKERCEKQGRKGKTYPSEYRIPKRDKKAF